MGIVILHRQNDGSTPLIAGPEAEEDGLGDWNSREAENYVVKEWGMSRRLLAEGPDADVRIVII